MKILPMHPRFKVPVKGSDLAGAYDLFMPEPGILYFGQPEAVKVSLGFAAEVPENHVALLLPRSGRGSNFGLELNNTCGVIDADYRGEWKASLRIKNTEPLSWEAGERLLQMLIVPVKNDIEFFVTDSLSDTARGTGGYGSTGK